MRAMGRGGRGSGGFRPGRGPGGVPRERREQDPPDAAGPRRLHPEAREAISKLLSPFCPGFMLEVCPTASAEALRDSLDALARTGVSADSLVELMLARHGEEYRAFPRRSGTGLLAWAAPPAALVLGLGVVLVVLRRMRLAAAGEDARAGAAGISDSERQRLEAALAELEAEEEAL